MNYNLVSNILGGKWLINPDFAQANMGLVFSVLDGKSNLSEESFFDKVSEKYNQPSAGYYAPMRSPMTGQIIFLEGDIEKGSTAVIPVSGPMMKYDGMCGELGSKTLTKLTQKADAHPNIDKILYILDGPGGMVSGTQTFADAIKATEKTTYGFVDDGMACSAHYWILASCDIVWSSHATNTIGSIGVYTQLANWKKYYEKEGLDIHEVYANQSSEKNKDYKDALEGNYKSLKEGHLDPIASIFIDHVKSMRGDKLNLEAGNPFKGAAYTSDIALSIGLIDRIGSLEELLGEIESSQTSNQSSNLNNTQMSLTKWLSGNKAGDGNGEEQVTIATSELNELRTDMEAAQANLEAAQATNQQLTADLSEANSAREAAENRVSELETENENLQSQVEAYGAQPGATHSVPRRGSEDLGEQSEVEISETDAEVKKMRAQFNYK